MHSRVYRKSRKPGGQRDEDPGGLGRAKPRLVVGTATEAGARLVAGTEKLQPRLHQGGSGEWIFLICVICW